MRSRSLLLPLFLCAVAPLSADILLSSGTADNRAAYIAGFLLTPAEAGFKTDFTAGDDAVPQEKARLLAVRLTARDTVTKSGMDANPLYLKIYDSGERAHLLGCSTNALRWDPPAGIPLGAEQTYRFENLTIPMNAQLWFALESAPEQGAPLGKAGLCLSSSFAPAGYATLDKDFKKFPGSPPTIALSLQPCAHGSAWPVRLGGASALTMSIGVAAFFGIRKRRKTSPALPPPPGQDLAQ